MKRVAVVAYTHPRTDARPRREASALVDRGDQVTYFGLAEDGETGAYDLDGVLVRPLATRRYRGSNARAYVASYLEFFARASAALLQTHLRRPFDVVHVHTLPDFMVFTALLPKLGGARVVLDVHDPMPELYESKFDLTPHHPLIRALVLQEVLSCRFADHVVATHELHREHLEGLGVPRADISVLLNVPDPRIFGSARAYQRRDGAPRVVYHGTIATRLGLDLAVQAVAQLVPDFDGLNFDIFGSGDAADEVRTAVRDSGVEESVHFPNRQFPVERVPAMVGEATIGLVPNRSDPSTRLMLPVKLLEYVHLGIPVVAPRLDAIERHFAPDCVAYYTPGDSDDMARALRELLDSETMRRAYATRAAVAARPYAWDVARKDLYAVIDGTRSRRQAS